jgi:hypothetical protein
MKLIDLDPNWFVDKEGRHGQGVSFLCPHCREIRIGVDFSNPIDGDVIIPSRKLSNGKMTEHWKREGDSFENLSLTPSVDFKLYEKDKDGKEIVTPHWHGFIKNGIIC